jgi:hypothetical protein
MVVVLVITVLAMVVKGISVAVVVMVVGMVVVVVVWRTQGMDNKAKGTVADGHISPKLGCMEGSTCY